MPHGLARDLDRFRAQHVEDTVALVRNLRTSLEGREASFDSYGVDGVHSARTRATDAESWAPHAVILGQLPDEAVQRELQQLVERVPRLGIATIANGETVGTGSIARISSATSAELVSPGEVMPPLPFTPQVLQGRELELVQELFATTEQDCVAAPVTAPVSTITAPADLEDPAPAAEAVLTVDEAPAAAAHPDGAHQISRPPERRTNVANSRTRLVSSEHGASYGAVLTPNPNRCCEAEAEDPSSERVLVPSGRWNVELESEAIPSLMTHSGRRHGRAVGPVDTSGHVDRMCREILANGERRDPGRRLPTGVSHTLVSSRTH